MEEVPRAHEKGHRPDYSRPVSSEVRRPRRATARSLRGGARLGVEDAEAALRAYDAAAREEAEERYGDFVDLADTGQELIVELRDTYAETLDEATAEEYREAFDRRARKRFPASASSSTRRGRSRARRSDRLLGLELPALARARLPDGAPGAALARSLRDALRHRRGEQHLLPASAALGGSGLGRAVSARLRLRRQGEPLPDAREAAHRPRPGHRALLRADRAARRVGRSSAPSSGSFPPTSTGTTSGSPPRCERSRRAGTASSSATRAGSRPRSTTSSAATASRS